ncbi:hypothetical protein ACWDLG_01625 [Nonomuraea sp. NPDC003727]
MEIGFDAARLLAGGRPPVDHAAASIYYTTVWGTTALATALILAAGRSALLLRRPGVPTARLRRATVTAAWCLMGALPPIAMVQLVELRQLMSWVPDSFIALCVAATAGAVTIALRLALAVRAMRLNQTRTDGDRGRPDAPPERTADAFTELPGRGCRALPPKGPASRPRS